MQVFAHFGTRKARLAFLALFVVAMNAVAQPISKEFNRATLVFKLTVSNPSTTPRHIVKVGVLSDARGEFKCVSAASALSALADYPIHFHVKQPETLIVADPLLAIPPKESAMFTISLYPNATGSCGPWYSDVRAVVLFDNGTRLESSSERIDGSDVAAARKRDPSREEVIAALRHRSADLRYQALQKVSNVNLDPITLETLVGARLEDPVRAIRREAYKKVGELRLVKLERALIDRFGKIPKGNPSSDTFQEYSAEVLDLATALLTLKSIASIDKILDVFVDPDFSYHGLLAGEIEKFQSPAMSAKLQLRLKNHIPWAALDAEQFGSRGPDNGGRYQALLSTLIPYRDSSSVNLLKQIMKDPANRHATRTILVYVLKLTDGSSLVQDPFVLAFHEPALAFAEDAWGDARINLRESAAILAVRTSPSTGQQQTLLRSALNDSSIYVRLKAAEEAALLNHKSLLPEVKNAHRTSSKNLQEYFCKPLIRLGGTCL